jgi:hypothetical protein
MSFLVRPFPSLPKAVKPKPILSSNLIFPVIPTGRITARLPAVCLTLLLLLLGLLPLLLADHTLLLLL